MPKKLPIFYSALLLTGVNLLLRLVGTSFQVYISGRIGAAGVGLLQLTMSVGSLAMVTGIAGVRTATMYLTAEELGKKRPGNVTWVLSGCFVYSILCSTAVAAALYFLAPALAENWIGDVRTVNSLRLFAAFLPVSCLCGVMTGYFTAANRIGTLAAVEAAEQLCSMVVTMAVLTLWAGDDPGRACQSVVMGRMLRRLSDAVLPDAAAPCRTGKAGAENPHKESSFTGSRPPCHGGRTEIRHQHHGKPDGPQASGAELPH